MESKLLNNSWENSNTQGETKQEETDSSSSNTTGMTPGLGESIKKICSKYGIQTHFKGNRTIKEMLVKPKDKDPVDKKSGTIYWYQLENLHAMRNT